MTQSGFDRTIPQTGQSTTEQAKQVGGQAVDQAKDVAAHTGERVQDVAQTAKSEAADLKDTAVAVGSDVVDSAKQHAGDVVDDVKYNAQHLVRQGVGQLKEQAGVGQSKLAEVVRALGDELDSMTRHGQEGPATQLVGQAKGIADQAAGWLENKDLEDIGYDVRRYAARKPLSFLAIAAGLGFTGARLVRGIQAANEPQPRQSHMIRHVASEPTTYRTEQTYRSEQVYPSEPAPYAGPAGGQVPAEPVLPTARPTLSEPASPYVPGPQDAQPGIVTPQGPHTPYGQDPGQGSNTAYGTQSGYDTNPNYGNRPGYGQVGDDRR